MIYLLLVFTSFTALGQGIELPRISDAECGWVGGTQFVCDFEYHLRQAETKTGAPGESWGMSIGAEGGYSLKSTVNGVTSSYGGSSSAAFWAGASNQAGQVAVVMQMYAPFFPGVYESSRGEAVRHSFGQSQKRFKDHLAELTAIESNLSAAQQHFSKNVAQPAIDEYKKNSLDGLAKNISEQTLAILETGGDEAHGSLNDPLASNTLEGVSPLLKIQRKTIQNSGDALTKLQNLENIWNIGILGSENALTASDGDFVRQTYDHYFDKQGLVNKNVVSEDTAEIGNAIGQQLLTLPSSDAGMKIRSEINRGLVAYDSTKSDDLKGKALGGVALAMGADQAYTLGDRQTAQELLKTSAAVIDTVLGFVPVVSSVNDATQILFGMATGHDYAGNPMTAGDFGLRGVSLLLGLIPAKAIIQVGQKTIGPIFAKGADHIRRWGLGGRFVRTLEKQPTAAVNVAEAVGSWVDEGAEVLAEYRPRHQAERIYSIIDAASPELREQIAKDLIEIKNIDGPNFYRGSFLKHYVEHVIDKKEFVALGINSPKQYLLAAQDLLTNKAAQHVLRPDGRTMHFLKETGEFAVTEDGRFVTYFVPKNAFEYFMDQLKSMKPK